MNQVEILNELVTLGLKILGGGCITFIIFTIKDYLKNSREFDKSILKSVQSTEVDVAKILVKLDNQDEKMHRLENENKSIRNKIHLLCNEVAILKNNKPK